MRRPSYNVTVYTDGSWVIDRTSAANVRRVGAGSADTPEQAMEDARAEAERVRAADIRLMQGPQVFKRFKVKL